MRNCGGGGLKNESRGAFLVGRMVDVPNGDANRNGGYRFSRPLFFIRPRWPQTALVG
jgi:hypothetical protein